MSGKSKAAFTDHTDSSSSSSSAAPPSFNEAIQSAPPPLFKSRFATISREGYDRIILINFSEAEIAAIHEAVRTNWQRGIDRVQPRGSSREIKLKGRPWTHTKNGDEPAILLTLRMMEALYGLGWVLYSAIEVTKKIATKDSLVFRKQDHTPQPCDWITVSFHSGDKLKILNSPPADLVNDIVGAFVAHLQRYELTPERAKLKFKGWPWSPGSQEAVNTQVKLLSLLEVLEQHGFTLYARMAARYDDEVHEANVSVFQRRQGWVPTKAPAQ
ncbi:hypothetical protein F66182_4408 [Fusarium sp. NRRL 66182]|nr:hypothetical protein F66182_4408 [Fusarium sp. NRRL 66182]